MGIEASLEQRRTYYQLTRDLPVPEDDVVKAIERVTELVPDAFNMKSARAVVVLGEAQDRLWDNIFAAFDGKVPREKIDGFKAGAGTVLYFTDESVVERLQGQFPTYAGNFPTWASQANGMLQISVWAALRELGVGASLQHYNPIIDEVVNDLTGVPTTWKLVAQMPFGGIGGEPAPKEPENISERVRVVR